MESKQEEGVSAEPKRVHRKWYIDPSKQTQRGYLCTATVSTSLPLIHAVSNKSHRRIVYDTAITVDVPHLWEDSDYYRTSQGIMRAIYSESILETPDFEHLTESECSGIDQFLECISSRQQP
jgi:hypothetical protein